MRDGLSVIEEKVNLSGEAVFDDTVVEVWGEAHGHTISRRLITNSQQLKLCNVIFSPALNTLETAHYFIRYKNRGGFLMTREAVLEQIKKEQWPFEEPYEFTSTRIRYPAKKAYFRLIFPTGFEPHGREFYDICLDHSYERYPLGFENFTKKGEFRRFKNEFGATVFEIDDNSPTIGNNYVFKWIPPKA